MSLLEIPADLVDRTFVMNPKTEDIVYGENLKDGMIVLFEDNIMSKSIEGLTDEDYSWMSVIETQRWCRITHLRRSPGSPILKFIGVYADGTKRVRTYNEDWAWLFKK